jgi:hypothetical protein
MADLSSIALERAAVPTGQRRNCRIAALLATTALVAVAALLPGVARAQDATWLAAPGSNNFNVGTNWSTATVPTGTAFFDTSAVTSLTFSAANTVVGGWTFNPGASSYTFTNAQTLTFNGAGVVINGGSAAITNSGVVNFNGSSTAGSATITTNNFTPRVSDLQR